MSPTTRNLLTRSLLILVEILLVLSIIGIIVATWLPIDRFRHWLQTIF
jgi:hypothetical protein